MNLNRNLYCNVLVSIMKFSIRLIHLFISEKSQEDRREIPPEISKKSVEEARVNQGFTAHDQQIIQK